MITGKEIGEAGRESAEEEGGETAAEETGFSSRRQEIGSMEPVNYLKLVDLRWSDQGDYFRVVAELKRGDMYDTTEVPYCFADYLVGDYEEVDVEEIMLFIRGIRREDVFGPYLGGSARETANDDVFQILYVTSHSIDPVPGVTILCSTNGQIMFRLSCSTSPMRIILDIKKRL